MKEEKNRFTPNGQLSRSNGHLQSETRSSHLGAVVNNLTRNHEVCGSVPALAQWVNDPVLP